MSRPGSLMLDGVRILLTTPYDLSIPGGVNNQLLGLYRYLRRETGAQVTLIGPSSSPDLQDTPDLLTIGRVIRLKMNGAVSNLTFDLRIRNRIRDLLRVYQPDIIHYQELFAPVLNAFALQFSKARNIATFHTCGTNQIGYTLGWPYLQYQARRLHARIAVSDAARRYVAKRYPGHYHLIPNGIDLEVVTRTVPAVFPQDKRNILFVGRTTEHRKGFSFLMKAYIRLNRQFPGQYRLIVAGTGQDAWRNTPGGSDILWLGQLSDDALNEAYAGCDLVCAPSIGGESFGLVLLEAFAHGKPAVGFHIEGYKDLVGSRPVAELVPNRDAAALAAALHALSSDPERYDRMSRSARMLAAEYDWQRVGPQVVALYEQTLSALEGQRL